MFKPSNSKSSEKQRKLVRHASVTREPKYTCLIKWISSLPQFYAVPKGSTPQSILSQLSSQIFTSISGKRSLHVPDLGTFDGCPVNMISFRSTLPNQNLSEPLRRTTDSRVHSASKQVQPKALAQNRPQLSQ